MIPIGKVDRKSGFRFRGQAYTGSWDPRVMQFFNKYFRSLRLGFDVTDYVEWHVDQLTKTVDVNLALIIDPSVLKLVRAIPVQKTNPSSRP